MMRQSRFCRSAESTDRVAKADQVLGYQKFVGDMKCEYYRHVGGNTGVLGRIAFLENIQMIHGLTTTFLSDWPDSL